MSVHKLKITAPLNALETKITIDDMPLKNVISCSFDISASGRPITEVTLKIEGFVEVDGEFERQDILHVDPSVKLSADAILNPPWRAIDDTAKTGEWIIGLTTFDRAEPCRYYDGGFRRENIRFRLKGYVPI